MTTEKKRTVTVRYYVLALQEDEGRYKLREPVVSEWGHTHTLFDNRWSGYDSHEEAVQAVLRHGERFTDYAIIPVASVKEEP